MARRVVVTGVGLVSALGIGTEETWKSLLAGKSGVAPITHFDTTGFPVTIAAEVKNFDPLQFVEKKELKKMGLFIQFALAATQFAMEQAKLRSPRRSPTARGSTSAPASGDSTSSSANTRP